MRSVVFKKKIERLHAGETPRVLDLFAGCGGISLGFHSEGFEITGAVEIDEWAAQTHAHNFHAQLAGSTLYEKHAKARDITTLEPDELIRDLGIKGSPSRAIDVIVGGPPCQAYTRVGRAKLREIAEHPEAFLQDPRSNLYLRYIHYVEQLKPLAILMENVPDVLNFGGHNIAEETCETLEALGYTCGYTMLNAVHYGVPEMRERMFLIAYRKEISDEVSFPAPTHFHELPRGYHGSRSVALKTIKAKDLFNEDHYYQEAPKPINERKPAVTAEEAINDLPTLTGHLRGELKRGARRFTDVMPYDASKEQSAYADMMKSWPEFANNIGIKDHQIRFLPRDYPLFERMNHGDQYPEAFEHAQNMFEEALVKLSSTGKGLRKGSKAYQELNKKIVPPYDPGKFPNKWRKMEPDAPARTLLAHLGKDSYTHIHYDCDQARTISVREAARLQSFPDGFEFCGTMNPAFRQIGNAVPPLMARSIATVIMSVLTKRKEAKKSDGSKSEVAAA